MAHTDPPAPGAVRGPLAAKQAPQLCSIASEPPRGDGWLSEVKFDGYRMIATVDRGSTRLLTRNGHEWIHLLPSVAKAISLLPVQAAMLVALRPDGISSFPDLHAALKAGRDDCLSFYAFDLLHLNGWDLRPCALIERKRVLAGLSDWTGRVRHSDHHVIDAHNLWTIACRMGLEGIVCKRAEAPYRGGRGRSWVKVKCHQRCDLIVIGWSPPAGSRAGIGALHVGYYDQAEQLHYAGGVGTGLTHDELRIFRELPAGMAADTPTDLLVAGDPIDQSVSWICPEIVIDVRFTAWSGAGRVRHPVYLGV